MIIYIDLFCSISCEYFVLFVCIQYGFLIEFIWSSAPTKWSLSLNVCSIAEGVLSSHLLRSAASLKPLDLKQFSFDHWPKYLMIDFQSNRHRHVWIIPLKMMITCKIFSVKTSLENIFVGSPSTYWQYLPRYFGQVWFYCQIVPGTAKLLSLNCGKYTYSILSGLIFVEHFQNWQCLSARYLNQGLLPAEICLLKYTLFVRILFKTFVRSFLSSEQCACGHDTLVKLDAGQFSQTLFMAPWLLQIYLNILFRLSVWGIIVSSTNMN